MPGPLRPADFSSRAGFRFALLSGLVVACLHGCGSVDIDKLPTPNQGSTVDTPSNGNQGPNPVTGATNKPSLSFAIEPVYCCNPRTRYFEAKLDNFTTHGAIQFSWSFGDGKTGKGQALEHTYSWPGNYTVSLQALLPDGTVLLAEQALVLSSDPTPPVDDDDDGQSPIVEGPLPEDGMGGPDGSTDDPLDPVEGSSDDTLNLEAIEQVRSGLLATANAAWWGFSPTDATDAIQAAINSRATTVVVPNMGQNWIVRPLFLASNKEIIFEDGVVLAAKPGAFRGRHDSLLTGNRVNNVKLKGYNAIFRMRKDDYTGSDYSDSEWRHVLQLMGVSNVTVNGLSFQSSGGDGIYIGPSEDSDRLPCRNVTIRDCDAYNNFRQGMSVLSAENLLVENCTFRNTIGRAPQAAVDLEPVDWTDVLINVRFHNCKSIGNAGSGFMANLSYMVPRSRPVSVLVTNHLVQNSRQPGLRALVTQGGPPGGYIEFRDCIVENTEYAGFATKWHLATAFELRFVNVEWRSVARLPDQPPLYFEFMGSGEPSLPGGIRFNNARVVDAQARGMIEVIDHQILSGAPDVSGYIFVDNPMISSPIPEDVFPLPNLNVVLNSGAP